MSEPPYEEIGSKSKFQSIKSYWKISLAAGLVFIISYVVYATELNIPVKHINICPITDFYRPSNYEQNKDVLSRIINDEAFRDQSAIKLQNSVRVNTVVFDDLSLDVEEDPEFWSKFDKFENFLNETFPIFYDHVELHKVNHYGLVYIWKGSNEDLKPLVLMAHQDTVPTPEETLTEWIHEPYAGVYDGENMYGRGVADCKNLLVGLLEAAEELITTDFTPKRTVIFSFGYDEEVSGPRNQNAAYIEELFGQKSIYAVLDEGGISLVETEGINMAIAGTGEKGYLDLIITLQTPGGHSSIPPDFTAIGIMGDLIVEIENDKFPTYFTEKNPAFWQYTCLAENSVDIDKTLKNNILKSQFNKRANKKVRNYIDIDRKSSYAIKTTQALDIIHGGAKANALPELVELTINSRIAIEETVQDVLDKFIEDTTFIAKKYNLGLIQETSNGTELTLIPADASGHFRIRSKTDLNPSPITPVGDKHWDIFAGTVRHLYEELSYPEEYKDNDKFVLVSPGIGSGNTDTKHYWSLTDHIYRYRPGVLSSIASNSHGINEYIKFDSHLQIIAFYFQYIQSVDEIED